MSRLDQSIAAPVVHREHHRDADAAIAEAIAALAQFGLAQGDAVLVKGSNSVGLGRLVTHFTDHARA